MTKTQLAMAAGVHRNTLGNWLIPHRKILAKMGVSPHTRVFPPAAVKYICETFDIDV